MALFVLKMLERNNEQYFSYLFYILVCIKILFYWTLVLFKGYI